MDTDASIPENQAKSALFSRNNLILIIGSLGGIGFVPIASGTVAVALVGIPLFYLMHTLHWGTYLVLAAVLFFVAVYVSQVGDRILGEKDSRKMVIDEIAGYAVAVFTLPFNWQIVVLSFFLERAIDIAKIPPANVIEKRVPGGWGVVLDDIVAGLYTLGIMKLLIAWKPDWMLGDLFQLT